MRKLLLFALVFAASSVFPQSKTARNNGTRKTTVKQSNYIQVQYSIDPYYSGEIGDWLPYFVPFQPQGSTIETSRTKNVDDVAQFLKKHLNVKIVIVGYTQAGPDTQSCRLLAEKRACVVKSLLVNRYKIDPSRLIANGIGIDMGFIHNLFNTSDAVAFFEQGYVTHLDYAEAMSKETMPIIGAVADILFSNHGNATCSRCGGTGSLGLEPCPKCNGKGIEWSEERAVRKSSDAINKLTSTSKKNTLTKRKIPTNGYQIKRYEDGTYEGYLINGKRNGRGIFYYDNGSRYVGEWKDDIVCGKGMFRMVAITGFGDHMKPILMPHCYIGTFEDGQIVETKVYIKDKETYIGNISKSSLSGYGKKICADKMVYEGEFKNNKYHGKGTLYSNSGKYTEGLWSDGKLQRVIREGKWSDNYVKH